MSKRRKSAVDDVHDRRFRNDPESGDLTVEEATLFEAARQAAGLLKKTFETWTVIGKAVVAARARADRAGRGKTFRRILEQQRLANVVPPATATRLEQIMARLPEVSAWHSGLSEQRQIAWASPSAVFKHCPVFAKTKAPAARKQGPSTKMHVEHAIDAILDHMQVLDVDERLLLITRILAPFDFLAAPKSATPKPARKAGKQADNALVWKDLGNETFDGVRRHGYEAVTATGSYSLHAATALPSGKFVGYSVTFRPTGSEPGQSRRIKDGVRTTEKAKALAQADHDRHLRNR